MVNTTCELGFQLKTRLTIHLTHYGISPQESQYCISGSLKRNLTEENILKPPRTHTQHLRNAFNKQSMCTTDMAMNLNQKKNCPQFIFVIFLHNRNFRPRNFTFESAEIRDKTLCKISHCV